RLRATLDDAPGGEVFRSYRRSADLAIAFARGSADGLPEDLHDWVHAWLRMNTSGVPLATLAWAFDARGDRDMAEHLLREALERMRRAAALPTVRPALAEWIDRKRTAWKLDDPRDGDAPPPAETQA